METATHDNLKRRIEELEVRLSEAEQLIGAIKAGEVDAFALNKNNRHEIYTLQTSDYAYRVLIESFSEGAANLSEEGMIVYINNYFHELLQLPYEKVIGTSIFRFIHPDCTEKFEYLFKKGLSGQSKGEISLLVNNETIEVYVSLTSLHPTLATVGMILTDLREKKKYEKALVEKNAFIETIIESSHEMIAVYDKDCTLITMNKACEHFLGKPREQLIGKKLVDLYPGAKGSQSELDLLKALQGEFVRNKPYRSIATGRYLKNYITPLRNEHGEVYAALAIATDLTDMMLAEEETRAANKKLEEKNVELAKSNAELASFSYIASHDLQEPLRKIQTFSDRILHREKEYLSENGKVIITKIQVAAERMQSLIDALLAYSRTSVSERKLERTDLRKIVEEVKEELHEELEEKNASVEVKNTCEISILPFQFSQLLHNLIGNSLKFSNGHHAPQITINAETVMGKAINEAKVSPEKEYHHISVTDNGIGFEPQYNEKIFELFQRLHGKDEYKGTGIGLSIVKRIVENHNGVITANGVLNKGVTIDIYLPVE